MSCGLYTVQSYTPTVDKSVPKLTWDSIGDSLPNSPNCEGSADNVGIKATAVILNSNFHMNSRSRSSDARASNTDVSRKTRMYRMATTKGVSCSSKCGTDSGKLLLPQVFHTSPLARAGRFSVHTHKSSVYGVTKSISSGHDAFAMKAVDHRSSLVARVFM